MAGAKGVGPGHGPGHGPGGPRGGFQKPKDIRRTVGKLLGYIGRSKWLLLVVAVCLVLNTACSIGGSYLLRPLIDECIVPGDYPKLARMLVFMACIYLCAAALSYLYSRIMVHIAQTATHAIRREIGRASCRERV